MLLTAAGIVGLGAVAAAYYFVPWLKTDLVYTFKFLRLLKDYMGLLKKNTLLVEIFESAVQRHPKRTYLWHEGIAYSYAHVDAEATKVAMFAKEIGLKCGDSVAMMIFNSPEFVWTLLGLQKLGVQVALLNTNIRSKSLQHCVSVSGAKVVIIGKDLLDAVDSIADFLKSENYSVWIQGNHVPSSFHAMDEVTSQMAPVPISPTVRAGIKQSDPAAFVYTSGTTGLPKAAIVTHKRINAGMTLLKMVCQGKEDDVVYITMPLYHTSALVIGLVGATRIGCELVLRKKFSTSAFWDDCRKYNVTMFLYIGELLRYLVNRPPQPDDKDHSVRVAIGNGLRPEIWNTFRDRFNIRQIREFYAATEGLGFFVNMGEETGSIGRLSPILRALYPMNFLKFDYETEAPVRGPDGLCIPSKPGETGLYVCAIQKGKLDFDGYKGKKELSDKKIIYDVLRKGDAYYNSGDLLRVDDMYNVYFVDRVGDTFRWKGENVSTTEVAAVLADDKKICHVNVYGVEVPGSDGRAGMAAITMNDDCRVTDDFLGGLCQRVMDYLPIYARPIFLRIQSDAETTSTYKYVKTNLQKQGFNPNAVTDRLFRLDASRNTYTPLDITFYNEVISGVIRL